MSRQLGDADGDQQTGDQGQQDGKRKTASGVGRPDDDGKGNCRGWRHVGDRLEERGRQANGVSFQAMRVDGCTHSSLL
jgi:hypothetical protein